MRRFLIYGFTGLGLELLWTALLSFVNKDFSLECHTSLLMLPVYGMAVMLEPVSRTLRAYGAGILTRGFIYAGLIFFVEYATGGIYTLLGICPWNYSGASMSVNGLIRWDYAPLWAGAGLFFEQLSIKMDRYMD